MKKKSAIETRGIKYIDYKNVGLLREFTTRFAKIKPRRYSGANIRDQKAVSLAIKRARFMGLLQYTR